MRISLITGLALAALAQGARAQSCAPSDSAAPAVHLVARALVGELVFQQAPVTQALALGCDSAAVRVTAINLQRPAQPNVRYRDVDVTLEIRAGLSALCSPVLDSLLRAGTGASVPRLRRLCASSRDTTQRSR